MYHLRQKRAVEPLDEHLRIKLRKYFCAESVRVLAIISDTPFYWRNQRTGEERKNTAVGALDTGNMCVNMFELLCGDSEQEKRKMIDIKSRKTGHIALTRDSTVDKKE